MGAYTTKLRTSEPTSRFQPSIITNSITLNGSEIIAGVLVSVFQTVTSIQDNVLAFIPRAAAIFVTFALTFPWMLRLLAGFAERLVLRLPEMVR